MPIVKGGLRSETGYMRDLRTQPQQIGPLPPGTCLQNNEASIEWTGDYEKTASDGVLGRVSDFGLG